MRSEGLGTGACLKFPAVFFDLGKNGRGNIDTRLSAKLDTP